ncbi:hypothetical protein KR054_004805, partial [Drosophila jambulina]
QLPDHRVREARVLRGEDVVLRKLNAMTNALRQIEKGFLLLIMTPPQPQSSERVDDNMSQG